MKIETIHMISSETARVIYTAHDCATPPMPPQPQRLYLSWMEQKSKNTHINRDWAEHQAPMWCGNILAPAIAAMALGAVLGWLQPKPPSAECSPINEMKSNWKIIYTQVEKSMEKICMIAARPFILCPCLCEFFCFRFRSLAICCYDAIFGEATACCLCYWRRRWWWYFK